jgi:hypothetical protein
MSRSPFLLLFYLLLPGDYNQRQGQRGDQAHQACHSLAESRHRRGQELGNLPPLYVLPQLLSLTFGIRAADNSLWLRRIDTSCTICHFSSL